MIIAKDFYWEMGHRLPNHNGWCKNPHGHSYKIKVILEGEVIDDILMDYSDLSTIVKDFIANLDHSFIVCKDDEIMLDFLKKNNFRHYVVSFHSTAENLAVFLANEIGNAISTYKNINSVKVQLFETEDVYAEWTAYINKN